MTNRILFFILLTLFPTLHAEEPKRPKIGLVLGGGGALGFAHVGVLQKLEELQIPIDYIGGTSMGAIVAGMYASGMSPDEIEKRFIQLDWWDVLKDHSSYQFLDYRKKADDLRFMGIEFGLKNWKVLYSPGMSYGQKLNNVLENFTLNSIGINDFDQLNIPYRAIVTDLNSGKSIALKSGNLATAMRASMAAPGAFTPVRLDGMVLVDGGILNNIPVEVIKNMGADLIIAVDVGSTAVDKSEESDYRSFGDVVSRTYVLMQRPEQEKQLAQADLLIEPDLPNASSTQFHKAKEIIPPGREAAEKLKEPLLQYAVDSATFQTYLKKQRLRHTGEIQVTDIIISGEKSVSEKVIQKRIKTKEGPLHFSTVRDDLNRIHGMGDFQTVSYTLTPGGNDEYSLEYNIAEKSWGPAYLHLGTKIEITTDSTALWSFLLNHTRTQLNSLGGEVRIDLEGGGHKRFIHTEWYQPISQSEQFFLATSLIYSGEDSDIYIDNQDIGDAEEVFALAALDAGISFFEYGEIRAGLLGGSAKVSTPSGSQSHKENDDLMAVTTHLKLDQLDNAIFPTKGYQFSLDGRFAFDEIGASETFSTLELKSQFPLTFGLHTLIPQLDLGSSLGTELPFYALFDIGGLDNFAGYAPYQIRGQYYGVGRLNYRYQLGKLPPTLGNGLFALARVDAGNAWFNASDARLKNLEHGILLGLGADSILGTCHLAVGKAESTAIRFYFTIGNTF